MKKSLAAGLALLACAALPAAAQNLDDFRMREGQPTELKQVAPDLYFLYDDLSSNSAFWVTEDGVLVIDTRQHPAHARDLIARIRKITDKPIKWALNTHAHGDHFLGNPEFKKVGTTILAHRDTLAGMIKNGELEVARRQAFFKSMNLDPKEVSIVYPDATFDSKLTIRMGGKTADVFYLGAGQNPGDTYVHFPHNRTLFIGGPFARKNWSNTSFTPSVDGWIAILQKLAAYDVDRFLPGHGDIGTKEDVLDEARLLADVQVAVKKAIAEGKSKEEIRKLPFPQHAHLRNYNRRENFLEALYVLYTTGKPQFPYGDGQ
jgi:glyoxylase-like metal-dependent hydrolase (beta-lactamase superfamily II)